MQFPNFKVKNILRKVDMPLKSVSPSFFTYTKTSVTLSGIIIISRIVWTIDCYRERETERKVKDNARERERGRERENERGWQRKSEQGNEHEINDPKGSDHNRRRTHKIKIGYRRNESGKEHRNKFRPKGDKGRILVPEWTWCLLDLLKKLANISSSLGKK